MNKKLLISIAVTITLVLTLAILYNFNIKGKKYSFSNKTITIKSGDNFYKALEKLEIKSSLSIKLFVKFNAEKIKKLDTGSFSFNGKYSVNSIVKTLQESSSSYVSVTIPEGFTVKQIKERLVKNSVISEEDFDKALSEVNDFYYYTPNGNFDGYFFPDTYQFYKGEDGKSVIMISSEMPELLGMCDRIYVMSEGRLAGEFTAEEATQERIMGAIMQEQNK